MQRNKLKTYAPQARRDFIDAVTARAAHYGLSADDIEPITEEGDVALIGGRPFPKSVAKKRKKLEDRIRRLGFDQTMEQVAYTWFNRLVAIRFMELHGYLDHGYRVLSHPEGHAQPEIVEHAEHVDLPGLDKQRVIDLKLEGTQQEELYRLLLLAQCNALHKAMPFLFESIDDETELLLPDHLLHSDSLIRSLVDEIPEEDWQEVEIIGWLYQFYISEKKDEVIGKVVKSEDIPAATQLFTPNWIVKYLVQNSLGRQWVATYPDSPLKEEMEYYIEPAEQTPEVQAQLDEITPKSLDSEELTLLDPACGSGHILVEAYDLLKAIYQERGYRAKDIPRLILEKNLYGLEIDDRAAQLAAFALMMKARADDRRIFERGVQPQVLAIQESKGLDAEEITEALNAPILTTELPPPDELFEEIAEEKSPLLSKKNLSVRGDISQADVAQLIDLFEHGKTFGSLIQVPQEIAERLPAIARRAEEVIQNGGMFEQGAAHSLKLLTEQGGLLAHRYDAVVANPPYMARKSMPKSLKSGTSSLFPSGKHDLYTCFVDRWLRQVAQAGHLAMVTMHSWMFLSRYEGFRRSLLSERTIATLAHFGSRAFGAISGAVVQTVAFTLRPIALHNHAGVYFRLVDGEEDTKKSNLLARNGQFERLKQHDFECVINCPIAYWVPETVLAAFEHGELLGSRVFMQPGLQTSNNERFLRLWHEVDVDKIGFGCKSNEEAEATGCKWFPYTKGGEHRKWYGNVDHVVNWRENGRDIKEYVNSAYPYLNGNVDYVVKDRGHYFRSGVSWTVASSSSLGVRLLDAGAIFDCKASCCFPADDEQYLILGFLSSSVAGYILDFMNPSVDTQVGNIANLPLSPQVLANGACRHIINEAARRAVDLSRWDWNASETAFGFGRHPLLLAAEQDQAVERSLVALSEQRAGAIEGVKSCQQDINRAVATAYGVEAEVSSEVTGDDTTLRLPDQTEEAQSAISYAVGCMMGRYSLDEPGLVYARSGGEGFDPSQYRAFPADEDGILPITELAWFGDDVANRLEQFIATVWPEEHLEENLEFVAESVGQKRSESARDAIRRYVSTGFYKHHLSLYKNRPIYWLFSSGKQRGFQALVYLHRYSEGTLARMRTEYVVPLLGKMRNHIDRLTDDIAASTSSQHRKRLEKEQATLNKQLAEVQSFDEKLRHYADQRISLDLDDGVKVNYGKFGDLLAEVKKVTGKKAEELVS